MTWKNTLEWDQRLTTQLRLVEHSGFWWRLAVLFAHSGDSWFWLPALFLIWVFTRGEWHSRSALLAMSIFALAVLVMGIKFTVKRSRPPGEWGAIYRQTDPHSFPSGHAARAFLLLVMGWALGPLWFAILLTFWAPLVSLSRISTGMHYLSDVLAGAAIGILGALFALLMSPILMHWFSFLF